MSKFHIEPAPPQPFLLFTFLRLFNYFTDAFSYLPICPPPPPPRYRFVYFATFAFAMRLFAPRDRGYSHYGELFDPRLYCRYYLLYCLFRLSATED